MLATGLLSASAAEAHDHWIVGQSRPVPGHHEITLDLFVGEALRDAEPKDFKREGTTRFATYRVGEQVDLLAGLGEDATPSLKLSSPKPGCLLVALDRDYAHIELDAQKFQDYLATEGFADAIEARTVAGEADKPGRERYRRFLKALIQLDGPTPQDANLDSDTTYATVVGQPLEIIPEVNPSLLTPGQVLPVRVLWQGQPLVGVELTAASERSGTIQATEYRTDAKGHADIAIDRQAVWMLRTVKMERCQDCTDADWESTWSSLTFTTRAPAPSPTPVPPPVIHEESYSPFAPGNLWLWRTIMIVGTVLGVAYWYRRLTGRSWR